VEPKRSFWASLPLLATTSLLLASSSPSWGQSATVTPTPRPTVSVGEQIPPWQIHFPLFQAGAEFNQRETQGIEFEGAGISCVPKWLASQGRTLPRLSCNVPGGSAFGTPTHTPTQTPTPTVTPTPTLTHTPTHTHTPLNCTTFEAGCGANYVHIAPAAVGRNIVSPTDSTYPALHVQRSEANGAVRPEGVVLENTAGAGTTKSPAVRFKSRTGNVANAEARLYFNPNGSNMNMDIQVQENGGGWVDLINFREDELNVQQRLINEFGSIQLRPGNGLMPAASQDTNIITHADFKLQWLNTTQEARFLLLDTAAAIIFRAAAGQTGSFTEFKDDTDAVLIAFTGDGQVAIQHNAPEAPLDIRVTNPTDTVTGLFSTVVTPFYSRATNTTLINNTNYRSMMSDYDLNPSADFSAVFGSITAYAAFIATNAATTTNFSTTLRGIGATVFHKGSGAVAHMDNFFAVRNDGAGTVTDATGGAYRVDNQMTGGLVTNAVTLKAATPFGALGGETSTFTNITGILVKDHNPKGAGTTTLTNPPKGVVVEDQTATNSIGVEIEGANGKALWIGSGADNTDAANGITFGASSDTNLYRSAANTLMTDDAFDANSLTLDTALAVAEGGTGATTLSDGYVLLGSATGAITPLDVTAKGSLLVGDGTTDPVALAVGTNTHVLTADSTEASGVKWAAAGGGTDTVVVMGSSINQGAAASTNNYLPVGGGRFTTTVGNDVGVVGVSGTVIDCYAHVDTPPGAGDTWTVTWVLEGSDQSMSCTISGAAATDCTDSTDFSITAGDALSARYTETGTAAASRQGWSCAITL